MLPRSVSQYDRYEGLQRRNVPMGLHMTPGAVYLNGVRSATDAELKSLQDPGFEQLTKLPAWETSIANAIQSASLDARAN